MKVGIISANWGVTAHLPAWRAIDGVEVVAICTSREESATAAANANNIPNAYWDYRAMAADPTIDIVDIGTRPDLREPMVREAFAAGKHAFAGAVFAASLGGAHAVAEVGIANRRLCALDTSFLCTHPAAAALR